MLKFSNKPNKTQERTRNLEIQSVPMLVLQPRSKLATKNSNFENKLNTETNNLGIGTETNHTKIGH